MNRSLPLFAIGAVEIWLPPGRELGVAGQNVHKGSILEKTIVSDKGPVGVQSIIFIIGASASSAEIELIRVLAEFLGVTKRTIDSRNCLSAKYLVFKPVLIAVGRIKHRQFGFIWCVLPWSVDDVLVNIPEPGIVEIAPRLHVIKTQPVFAEGVWGWLNIAWVQTRVFSGKDR